MTQNCVLRVQWKILKENNLSIEKTLPKQFRSLIGKLSAIPGNSSTWSSKLHFLPLDRFEDSEKILKFETVCCLPILRWNFSALPQKGFVRSVETELFEFSGILRKYVFSESAVCLSFSGHWAEKSGHPAERPSLILMKLYVTNPEKKLNSFSFVKKRFLIFLGNWAKAFWPFRK